MIDAHIPLIPVLPLRGVGQVVVERAVVLRRRVGIDQLPSHRIESRDWNDVAGKRVAGETRPGGARGERIEDAVLAAEITAAHGHARHADQGAVQRGAPEALIIHEEECPVLAVINLGQPDRAAQREPELVVSERREGRASNVEETASVHSRVAQELEGAAVHPVRARLRHHVDHGARVAAEVRAVEIRLHLEFLHRLHGGPENNGEGQALVVIDAVIEEIVRALAVAVGEDLRAGPAVIGSGTAHDRAGHAEADAIYAWRENRQLNKVPPIERQLVNKPLANHAAERRGLAFEKRRGGGHLHGLVHLAHLHRKVYSRPLIDFQGDTAAQQPAKALCFDR